MPTPRKIWKNEVGVHSNFFSYKNSRETGFQARNLAAHVFFWRVITWPKKEQRRLLVVPLRSGSLSDWWHYVSLLAKSLNISGHARDLLF